MKNKFLLCFLILFVLFSTVNLAGNNTYAVSSVDVDLDFSNDGSGTTDKGGREWDLAQGSLNYTVDNRLELRGLLMSNSGSSNFVNQLNAQKDFYVESKFSFMSFNDSPVIIFMQAGETEFDLGLLYDHPTRKFVAGVEYEGGPGFGVEIEFPETYNFSLGTDYTVALSRIGNEIILFVDGVASTPFTLTDDLKAGSANLISLGNTEDHDSWSNISMLDFKMVSDATYSNYVSDEDSDEDADSSHNTEVTITGGLLEAQSSSLTLDSVEFDSDSIQTTTGSSLLTVSDNRTTGAGWNVKISATDFKNTLPDPSGGSGNITVSLPASSLSVDPNNLTSLSGQDDESISSVANAPLSNLGTNLITAAAGYGMGKYSLDLDFTLSIPKTVKVTNVSGTGSKYIVGDIIGIPKGTYSSTITYTIGTGL